MKIEQIYTGCLAQGAYYIESEGEAVIIDPLREVKPYLEKARKDGAMIRYVLETHFHADFVSGHQDLARQARAKIVFGPNANPNPDFMAHIATDGEIFQVGKVSIKVLHTPGHTMESTCYLLRDESGKDVALFSGDTLFIGDVGRPDLAQKAAHMTQEQLAETLFDSLRTKIMPLADDIVVYPAHGAGSACGKNMSKETSDSLGHQKMVNYALRADMTRAEFVKEVTEGLQPPPAYFPLNVAMNRDGYDPIGMVMERGTRALSPGTFESTANIADSLLLDTRSPQSFAKGFIPNSINIGIDGSFAPWVGAMILDVKQNILLITDPGREEETVMRLARVGYDHCLGYLQGGFEAWKNEGREIDFIESIDVERFAEKIAHGAAENILDVRKPGEFDAEHMTQAESAPLDFINESMAMIDKNKTYHIHCAGGYRSMIFISALRARGYDNLIDVAGGFAAIKKNGSFELSSFVCSGK
jgi:hydroxyacylglutathione hydrolase